MGVWESKVNERESTLKDITNVRSFRGSIAVWKGVIRRSRLRLFSTLFVGAESSHHWNKCWSYVGHLTWRLWLHVVDRMMIFSLLKDVNFFYVCSEALSFANCWVRYYRHSIGWKGKVGCLWMLAKIEPMVIVMMIVELFISQKVPSFITFHSVNRWIRLSNIFL